MKLETIGFVYNVKEKNDIPEHKKILLKFSVIIKNGLFFSVKSLEKR